MSQRRTKPTPCDACADAQPFIIGITGSYGKSSTKSMLAHILQFKGPTLAASGSINTLMGITRHIREDLVFGHGSWWSRWARSRPDRSAGCAS